MSNLKTYYHFKLNFQKVDQNTGGTKRRKENQLQSLELPCRISSRGCKHDIKETEGDMFNPIFKDSVQARKHPGSCAFAKPELLSYRTPKV